MQDDPLVGLLVVFGVLAGLAALLVLATFLEPEKPQAPSLRSRDNAPDH